MNPLQSKVLSIICEQLGVSDIERVTDPSVKEMAHTIALNFAVQTQMLGAASAWSEATHDQRKAVGGEMNVSLGPNGAFEVFGRSDT